MTPLLVNDGNRWQNWDCLAASFRLRKRILADKYGWDVHVYGESEFDALDDMRPGPTYLLVTDGSDSVIACLRLMETIRPTLLSTVFGEVVPPGCVISRPGLWEATRFALDTPAFLTAGGDIVPLGEAIRAGLREFVAATGADELIGLQEPHFVPLIRKVGLEPVVISKVDFRGCPCVLTRISLGVGAIREKSLATPVGA